MYILPLLSVIESFRRRPAEVKNRYRPRRSGRCAAKWCCSCDSTESSADRPPGGATGCRGLVVLVEDQGKKHAVLVDELLGQMQAVVKSLDTNYQRVEGLAGATILGNGRVANDPRHPRLDPAPRRAGGGIIPRGDVELVPPDGLGGGMAQPHRRRAGCPVSGCRNSVPDREADTGEEVIGPADSGPTPASGRRVESSASLRKRKPPLKYVLRPHSRGDRT